MVLSEKHLKCIELMIKGENITDIAKILPSSRTAIYNWLDDKDFKVELDRQIQLIKTEGE